MQLSSHCIASCAQPWNDKNGNNYVYLNLIGARKFLRGSSTGPVDHVRTNSLQLRNKTCVCAWKNGNEIHIAVTRRRDREYY